MKRAILVGGGSSVNEGRELGLWEKIQGQDIWSVNYAFRTMPYLPTRQCWCDITFFRNNMDDMQRLAESGVLMMSKTHDHYNNRPITQHFTTREEYVGAKNMIEQKKLFIGAYGLSGTFALSCAVVEGYDEIYLLGYDFGTSNINDKNTHYYQHDKMPYVSCGVGNSDVYMTENGCKKEVRDYEHYLQEPCKIFNVSPKSNIQCFPKITYEQFFNQLKG
jgi:hypothetical protein